MLSAAARRLIAEIEDAFPDAPPPPYDRRLDHLLPEDNAVFRGARWREIVSWRLPYDAVFFFADEAYRYYLPALMIALIRWPRRAGKGNLMSSTVSTLLPPRRNDPSRAGFAARMDALTAQQRRAVRAFLLHVEELHPLDHSIGRAVQGYWDGDAG